MYAFAHVIYKEPKESNQRMHSQISVYQDICLYKNWARYSSKSEAGG
jgi:hypothetical protein